MCIYEDRSPCDPACKHLRHAPSLESLQALFLPLPPLPVCTEQETAFVTEVNALAGENEQRLQSVAAQSKQLEDLYTGLQGSVQGLKTELRKSNK